MILFLYLIDAGLWIALFFTKNIAISLPLFFVGLVAFMQEVLEMKRNKKINSWQLTRGTCILFFEFMLFINYFFHFLDFLFE